MDAHFAGFTLIAVSEVFVLHACDKRQTPCANIAHAVLTHRNPVIDVRFSAVDVPLPTVSRCFHSSRFLKLLFLILNVLTKVQNVCALFLNIGFAVLFLITFATF